MHIYMVYTEIIPKYVYILKRIMLNKVNYTRKRLNYFSFKTNDSFNILLVQFKTNLFISIIEYDLIITIDKVLNNHIL